MPDTAVSGRCYLDKNGNGTFDAGDEPLAGFYLDVRDAQDGTFLAGGHTQADGTYDFIFDAEHHGSQPPNLVTCYHGGDYLNTLPGTLPGVVFPRYFFMSDQDNPDLDFAFVTRCKLCASPWVYKVCWTEVPYGPNSVSYRPDRRLRQHAIAMAPTFSTISTASPPIPYRFRTDAVAAAQERQEGWRSPSVSPDQLDPCPGRSFDALRQVARSIQNRNGLAAGGQTGFGVAKWARNLHSTEERLMPPVNLGRLERVGLRHAWASEASDFTPWLAQPENIVLIGDAIGVILEVQSTERRVGPFRADILCRDVADDSWVLVENQLERTDHVHLGQLITYAAGLDAVTVVWIAEHFTEEHRAALDWLNRSTNEGINFFGMEIELWRIGDSAFAPKFNVVCRPNDWARMLVRDAERAEAGGLSETRQKQLAYWQAFIDRLHDSESPLRPEGAKPRGYLKLAFGKSGFSLTATLGKADLWAGIVCNRPELWPQIDGLKTNLPGSPEWPWQLHYQEGRKQNYIGVHSSPCNWMDEADWTSQHAWLQQRLEELHDKGGRVLRNFIFPPPFFSRREESPEDAMP